MFEIQTFFIQWVYSMNAFTYVVLRKINLLVIYYLKRNFRLYIANKLTVDNTVYVGGKQATNLFVRSENF